MFRLLGVSCAAAGACIAVMLCIHHISCMLLLLVLGAALTHTCPAYSAIPINSCLQSTGLALLCMLAYHSHRCSRQLGPQERFCCVVFAKQLCMPVHATLEVACVLLVMV